MSQLQPFFSIIIPTYNSDPTISRCLESVSQQSFTGYEVLVIDGNSSDETIVIARDYLHKIPRLKIFSEKDKGVYDAMNKGIDLVEGRYIYFLGSDDSLLDDHVLAGIAEKIDQTKAKVIYGNVIMRGSNQYVTDGYIHAGEFNLEKILYQNICHQAIFYARDVFENLGRYNLKYPVFADYDFNLRAFAKYEFVYADMLIANFKVGGISTVVTDNEFERDRGPNIISYFYKHLFKSAFMNSRIYMRQAALSPDTALGLSGRLYCLIAYAKLKVQSMFMK